MDENTTIQEKMTPEQEARYKEIRAIHWTHRTKEQNEEYEKLKPMVPKPTPAEIDARIAYHREKKDQPKEVIVKQVPYEAPKDENTIVTTKEGLKEMLKEMMRDEKEGRSILQDNEWQEYELPKQRRYTATIKLWQKDYRSPKGMVVDWHRARFQKDLETKENIEYFDVTIRYDGGKTEVVEMPIIEFSRFNEIERVEIVSIKERKLQMKQGEVRASVIETDDTGFETIFDKKTNKIVPLLVLKDEPIATIKRANGETFNLPVSRLNQ